MQGRWDVGEDKGNEGGRREGKKRREMFLLHFIQKYMVDRRQGCGTGQTWSLV